MSNLDLVVESVRQRADRNRDGKVDKADLEMVVNQAKADIKAKQAKNPWPGIAIALVVGLVVGGVFF